MFRLRTVGSLILINHCCWHFLLCEMQTIEGGLHQYTDFIEPLFISNLLYEIFFRDMYECECVKFEICFVVNEERHQKWVTSYVISETKEIKCTKNQ